MKAERNIARLIGTATLVCALLAATGSVVARDFDPVIRNGRVMDPEIGTHGPYVDQWYKDRDGKNQVNYGQAVAHEFARAEVLDGFNGAQDVRTAVESRKGDL